MAVPDRLYLGSRRYSSWSFRGWLAVRLAGLTMEDVVVPLAGGNTVALKSLTPSGLVPALSHGGCMIWDSLAICEYCAELAPKLWPADRGNRAVARSVAAEMHSGFRDLRLKMPMSLGRVPAGRPAPAGAEADIARIESVWQGCLAHCGPFLFGDSLTIPDVMYAPVTARFLSYGPPLSDVARAYCDAVRASPLVDTWYSLAAQEPPAWRLPQYD